MSRPVSRRDLVRAVVRQLLEAPLEQTAIVRRLAAYMVQHGMAGKADVVMNDIAHELQKQTGLLTAEVESARPLTATMRQELQTMLRAQTGADKVVLHETTDQGLLGGFVARTPDAEMNASVRAKLKRLSALA